MKKIVMTAAIFVRGVMVAVGDELTLTDHADIKDGEINPREAKELVARGVAKDAAEVEESEELDTTKPLEKMKKDELIAYAAEIAKEVDGSMTKAEIIEVITEDEE